MDFDNFKINCSQIGSLMGNSTYNKPPTLTNIKKLYNILGRDYQELTEAQKATARDIMLKAIEYNPKNPSDKMLSELILIYTYEMYGKTKISKGNDSPLFLEKGTMAEPDSIKMLSKADGIQYEKNTKLFENKWFKGIPDIIIKESGKVKKIIEVKTSYDLPSFIMSIMKPEKSDNMYEIMGYMDLLKIKTGEIVHCLVDMPERITTFQEKRMKERYEWLELEESVIADRLQTYLGNMEYSAIPDELKIFRRPVTINQMSMKGIKSRSNMAKKWIKGIHDAFTSKLVNLSEIETDNQEDNIQYNSADSSQEQPG